RRPPAGARRGRGRGRARRLLRGVPVRGVEVVRAAPRARDATGVAPGSARPGAGDVRAQGRRDPRLRVAGAGHVPLRGAPAQAAASSPPARRRRADLAPAGGAGVRILVTGGAGFIGGHLVERLAGDGHELLVVDDLSTGSAANLPPRIRLLEADFVAPAARVALASFRPAAVVHLAAQIDAAASVLDPLADARTNVISTLELLEICRSLSPRPRLLFASSAAVYPEDVALPAVESAAGSPATPYGVAKLAVEHYLACYRSAHGLASAALRFANVYGPRQGARGEGGVVAIFARALASGGAPRIFGDGRQTRDFVHVADVAEAIARALGARAQGTFNVSTGVETDIRTVFASLAGRLRPGAEPELAPPRPGDVARSALSYGAIASALGWRPSVALAEGLAGTADWFRTAAGKDPE
ncbi:MAG: NAD-dependent epimerase/dehydratase family protein, partial [Thermoanaerobaculia bacterium]